MRALYISLALCFVTLLCFGISSNAEAQTPVGSQARAIPLDKRVLQTGQTIRPTHWTGKPDYSKPYWKVDQKGHLIHRMPSGLMVTDGQNYIIEGNKMKPLDGFGKVKSGGRVISSRQFRLGGN